MDRANESVLEVIEDDNWLWEPGEIISVPLGRRATIRDMRRTRLKTEIVRGDLIVIGPSGDAPATATRNILLSLHLHEERHGGGCAMTSRFTYVLDLPHRDAICPDVSWNALPLSASDHGAPVFAVEVRDWMHYGDEAGRRLAAKRADYFAAGTQVVWDVDVLREGWIRCHRASEPDDPVVFRRGEIADAEPAVPGWRFAVDDLFRSGKQDIH